MYFILRRLFCISLFMFIFAAAYPIPRIELQSAQLKSLGVLKIPVTICNKEGNDIDNIKIQHVVSEMIVRGRGSQYFFRENYSVAHIGGGACVTTMISLFAGRDHWLVSFECQKKKYFSRSWSFCSIDPLDTALPPKLDLYLDHYDWHMYRLGSFRDTGCTGKTLLHSGFSMN
jgi:hypothetical protein